MVAPASSLDDLRRPLNDAALWALAPAVFARAPAPRTSLDYVHVPTIRIVDALREDGWDASEASGAGAHGPHMVRFRARHADPLLEGLVPEVIVLNSHDGSSSLRFMSAARRLVCWNGLIASTTYTRRYRHERVDVAEVVRGARDVASLGAAYIRRSVRRLQDTRMSSEEQRAFAERAIALRWPTTPDDPDRAPPLDAEAALAPRRDADAGPDLWTIFNVVQENLIRGGLDGRTRTSRITTRAVVRPDVLVRLNLRLWKLAEEYTRPAPRVILRKRTA